MIANDALFVNLVYRLNYLNNEALALVPEPASDLENELVVVLQENQGRIISIYELIEKIKAFPLTGFELDNK